MRLSAVEFSAYRAEQIQTKLTSRGIPGSVVITRTAGVSTALWKTSGGVVVSTRGDDPVETIDSLHAWICTLLSSRRDE
jgi:hypothetical protein